MIKAILRLPLIRPFDFLLNSAPGLDDTYWSWGHTSGPGYYRPINKERRAALNVFYEQTALGLYNGFAKRMAVYAEKGDAKQKHLAALFSEAQKR